MNEAFVESIRRLELTPVSHRITPVRLAGAAAVFLFIVDGVIARRSRGPGFPDVALDSHEEPIAFTLRFSHVKVPRREGKLDLDLSRAVRFVSYHAIASGRLGGHGSGAGE